VLRDQVIADGDFLTQLELLEYDRFVVKASKDDLLFVVAGINVTERRLAL
jgi:hypothetical protein